MAQNGSGFATSVPVSVKSPSKKSWNGIVSGVPFNDLKTQFALFAISHGVNVPIMAHCMLPTWIQSREERCTIHTCKVGANHEHWEKPEPFSRNGGILTRNLWNQSSERQGQQQKREKMQR